MQVFDLENTTTFIDDARNRVEHMQLVNDMIKGIERAGSILQNGNDYPPIYKLPKECTNRIIDVLQDELLRCKIELYNAVVKGCERDS